MTSVTWEQTPAFCLNHALLPQLHHPATLLTLVAVVQSLICVRLFATPWTAAHQASLSFTNSWSLLKLMSIESVMPSNSLFLCCPLLLLPSIFPSIRVFSNESALRIRWPKYWSFSFSISPSSEYSGLISFRMDWFNLLAVHGASEESSPTPQFKSINSSALSLLYGPTLTSIHDYWRHHSFDYMDFCCYPDEKADLQGKAALCQVNANATLPLPWWPHGGLCSHL